jgi:hypothetical protein
LATYVIIQQRKENCAKLTMNELNLLISKLKFYFGSGSQSRITDPKPYFYFESDLQICIYNNNNTGTGTGTVPGTVRRRIFARKKFCVEDTFTTGKICLKWAALDFISDPSISKCDPPPYRGFPLFEAVYF